MLNIPLMLIPWAIYNVFAIGTALSPWDLTALSAELPSGAVLKMSSGEILLTVSLLALLLDVAKAARGGVSPRLELCLTGAMVLVFAVELVAVDAAGTATFAMLTTIALVDGLASTLVARRAGTGGRIALERGSVPPI